MTYRDHSGERLSGRMGDLRQSSRWWVNGRTILSAGLWRSRDARALSELRKQGWQPKRTIVLALWDGEDLAAGSTEWAENIRKLSRKAVVYINSDTNSRARLPLQVAYVGALHE